MTNVLLVTSNGTGMGHLTRQLAVALAIDGEHQANLFSLSVGLPLATALGVRGEYCPSHEQPWIASRDWQYYLRDRLLAIVEETQTEVVLFDGVAPYPGLGRAMNLLRGVAFVWLRRGMWRKASSHHLRKSSSFDLVIEPGDLAGDADHGPTAGLADVLKVSPISLTEVLEPIPRDEARLALGLPPDPEVALVTLGSGRLGDVAGPGEVALRTLLEESDCHVAVTSSAVAENAVSLGASDRVSEVRGTYPLVPYLSAFDLAVSSAGYNAVHELVPAGVGTLFIANTSTQTDNQTARSNRIAQLGLGLHAEDTDPDSVAAGIRSLLDSSRREKISQAAVATKPGMTGAAETGETVASFGAGFTKRHQNMSALLSIRLQLAKERLKEALGEQGTAAVRRLLGRPPAAVSEPAEVRLVDQPEPAGGVGPLPLAVTETITIDHLRNAAPFEHLLPGSDSEYRKRRLDIVHRYYDVVA